MALVVVSISWGLTFRSLRKRVERAARLTRREPLATGPPAPIYCVEVLAIYESFGAIPAPQRVTNRDSDFALAQALVGQVGKAVAPQANEYIEVFDAPSRYGTGWRCRQWIQVQADAAAVGDAIYQRLSGRSPRDGSKVEVFPLDPAQPGYVTGDLVYRRRWPAGDPIG